MSEEAKAPTEETKASAAASKYVVWAALALAIVSLALSLAKGEAPTPAQVQDLTEAVEAVVDDAAEEATEEEEAPLGEAAE